MQGSSVFSADQPFFLVSSSRKNSPQQAFRAESETHITKDNEQFVRDHHPSLSSQGWVFVSESVFGAPVWVIGSPLSASQSVYAGGRPIHYYPGDYSQFIDCDPIRSPQLSDRYNQHFNRYINPRRFLTPADLDSLRELFPEAVGAHLLISGFLIILFEEIIHVQRAYSEIWPLELAGLRVFFHLTKHSLTTTPIESGSVLKETVLKEISEKLPDTAGCLGLKLRLQDGLIAVTSVTHGFVRCPSSWRKSSDRLRIFPAFLERAKLKLKRSLPFKTREDDPSLIRTNEILTDNNPVGKEVSLVLSNKMVCSPTSQSCTFIIILTSLDWHNNAHI